MVCKLAYIFVILSISLPMNGSEVRYQPLTPEQRTEIAAEIEQYQKEKNLHKGIGHYMRGVTLFSFWAVNNCGYEIRFMAWLVLAPLSHKISMDGFRWADKYQKKIDALKMTLEKDVKLQKGPVKTKPRSSYKYYSTTSSSTKTKSSSSSSLR